MPQGKIEALTKAALPLTRQGAESGNSHPVYFKAAFQPSRRFADGVAGVRATLLTADLELGDRKIFLGRGAVACTCSESLNSGLVLSAGSTDGTSRGRAKWKLQLYEPYKMTLVNEVDPRPN